MSRLLLTSSLLLVLALPAWSESQPAEIERLIKQLESDSFAEREGASKALKDIGEPALDALRKATKVNDLEVRLRAELLVVPSTTPEHRRSRLGSRHHYDGYPRCRHEVGRFPGRCRTTPQAIR